MKDNTIWVRVENNLLEYIEKVREIGHFENRSQTIRTILKIAEENNIGLS